MARIASRNLPGWRVSFLPKAIAPRRWRAMSAGPLSAAQIRSGMPGALFAPTLGELELRVRHWVRVRRLIAFHSVMRRWRR
ncbi:hypothetical protein BQ8420_28610 [Nocardiopsis sp. JB363]|nr:hypothetical protein BQ8420_28610 [Nocardiopsis sp. JB363]